MASCATSSLRCSSHSGVKFEVSSQISMKDKLTEGTEEDKHLPAFGADVGTANQLVSITRVHDDRLFLHPVCNDTISLSAFQTTLRLY